MGRGLKPGQTNSGSFRAGNKIGKGRPPIPEEIKAMRQSGRDNLIRIIAEVEGMTEDQLDLSLQKPKLTILEKYIIESYKSKNKDIIRECQNRIYGIPSPSNKVFEDEKDDTSQLTIILKKDYEMVDLETNTGIETE
jgi:hypothetical protein